MGRVSKSKNFGKYKNKFYKLHGIKMALERKLKKSDLSQRQSTIDGECLIRDEHVERNLMGIVPSDHDHTSDTMPIDDEVMPDTDLIKGRRVINFIYFFNTLKAISQHNPKFDCGLKNLIILSEKQLGLLSILKLKCNMCHETFSIHTEEPNLKSAVDVNKSAVSGIMAIGCGASQLQELCASLDLPIISDKFYNKLHFIISEKWENTAKQMMKEAANREYIAAVEEGRIDKDGTPVIDVVADGCWSKRSYKKNYSALSGAAAIVGKKFGEVLYMSVKNKYCCICSRADKKDVAVNDHKCFKNYTGPSTGMESDILVEGFKQSVKMYGIIYGRLISDGDSSTYCKILEARPYPNYTVEKIECRNHVLRNMCNKLFLLITNTSYPLKFRKILTKQKILCIRKLVIRSILHNKTQNKSLNEKIKDLYQDILGTLVHVFGFHDECKSFYCEKKSATIVLDINIKYSTLWLKLKSIISSAATHSRSLICDVDSNIVERFHSIVAKFVGGKRINYSLKQSYQARCSAAVVAFNSRKPLYNLHKKIIGASPKSKVHIFEERRLKRANLKKQYIRKKNHGRNTPKSYQFYGDRSIQTDMSNDAYESARVAFLDSLKEIQANRVTIERETILQSDSSEWLELRRNLLTASIFGKVIKRRQNISCAPLVKNLLYKINLSNVASISHGRENEKTALNQLASQENVIIESCGLFIDECFPFLGATPDGLCEENMVVEVKCPITAYKLGLDRAISDRKIVFWKKDVAGNYIINKKSDWYFQIQGQLHITKRKTCLFGVWSGVSNLVKVEYIQRDDTFWKEHMETKLCQFYFNCLLPELVDPRMTRNMEIRDPPCIKEAIRIKEIHKINDIKKKKQSEKKLPTPITSLCAPSTQISGIDIKNNNEIETDDQDERNIHLTSQTDLTDNRLPLRNITASIENIIEEYDSEKDMYNSNYILKTSTKRCLDFSQF